MSFQKFLAKYHVEEVPTFDNKMQLITSPKFEIMDSFISDEGEQIIILANITKRKWEFWPKECSGSAQNKINDIIYDYFPEAADSEGEAQDRTAKTREGANLKEYMEYKLFFDKELEGAKKDRFDEKLKIKDGSGFWQPCVNRLEALKGAARIAGLKMGMIKPFLSVYEEDLPKELLCKIEEWDGQDHIAKMAMHLVCQNLDALEVIDALKHWLAHAVKRMETGDQNIMIILQGGQGIGKDTWIESFCSGFSPYFNHFSDDNQEKDVLSKLCKNIIVNISEVDKLNRKDPGFVKDIITRRSAQFRKAYAQDDAEYRVIASLIGSTNTLDFLTDHTGNRRFWVFKLEDIDHGYSKKLGAQILAQAMILAKEGYHAKHTTIAKLNETAESLTPIDPDQSLAEFWNSELDLLSTQRERFSEAEVKEAFRNTCSAFGFKINKLKGALGRLCAKGKTGAVWYSRIKYNDTHNKNKSANLN